MRSKALLALFAVLTTTACRTTQPSSLAGVKQDGLSTTLAFDKKAEQSLYLKMLQVEAASGIQTPKDRVHATTGLLACQKQGELENCSLHVQLDSTKFSSSQPLDPVEAGKIWNFARSSRPELVDENKIFADLRCSYLGKKSPPYKVDDVTCRVSHPRLIREAIFEERSAEELAELLRGQGSYGQTTASFQGVLACQQITGSTRRVCMVRAVEAGVLAETVREVSAAMAGTIASELWRTYYEMTGTEKDARSESERSDAKAPKELAGSLRCIIDSTKLLSEGRRHYVCRATL